MFDKSLITTNKNLLAFSAGVDSSALFFILLEKKINFDIIIVDYNLRKQSKQEIQYAKELAKKYNKKIYLKTYEKNKFSEKLARDFRYEFFDEIIINNNYESLITAHQLNDQLEWFLMQLTKGAGLIELIGLNKISNRKNYKLFKPLLDISKNELLDYLKNNNFKYFIDETNVQNIYKRNYFRNNFSNQLIDEFKVGIKKSFSYLNKDINSLNNVKNSIYLDKLMFIEFFNDDFNLILRFIDKKLKEFGIIISSDTKNEILKQKSIVISNKYCIEILGKYLYIAPYKNYKMSKKFKELCRINKIPKNIRPYLFKKSEVEINNFLKNRQKVNKK